MPTWRCTPPRRPARTGYRVFEPTMHAAIVARHELSAELSREPRPRRAVGLLPADRVTAGWADRRRGGARALAAPGRGLVGPSEFVQLAEETGRSCRWGAASCSRPAGRRRAWSTGARRMRSLTISVNLSAPAAPASRPSSSDVKAILRETGLEPWQLVLEMTETVMFHDTATTIVTPRGAPRSRGPDRHRRLRDRLLVARLPATLPGRHPQDRA